MEFSLAHRTVTLSVGEFAGFRLGPREGGDGGGAGLWRAQLGQHWHRELQQRTQAEHPDARFEVVIEGPLVHRGWTFRLQGRIDQVVGPTLREIKTVMHPVPVDEAALRADYPDYFLQLAAYLVLLRTAGARDNPALGGAAPARGELVFVETGAGLAQTVALTPFDEALVFHQLDAIVEFLNLQQRAAARRQALVFHSPFATLRPGQETIQADLAAAFTPAPRLVLFEAPTGYGKTGCALEFALTRLRAGAFARVVWLSGKSTGQLQVVRTLAQMTAPPTLSGAINHLSPLPAWQVRNKGEHCVNHTFHCVRDGCDYLRDCTQRWPASGLARFYTQEHEPRDLEALRAAGRQAAICPYEITRAALPFNDVWIGDYNYVFAPDNRGFFFDRPGFDPAATLLVVDEAHNLPARVAGAHSRSASESDARLLLAELDHLRAPAALVLAVERWTRLLALLDPTDALDPVQEADLRDHVRRLAELVTVTPLDHAALGPQHCATLWGFAALESFLDDGALTKLLWVPRAGQLELTCLDAAPVIADTLRRFGGALLMSATLEPAAEFAESCGLPAPAADGPRPWVMLTAPTPWRQGAYDVAVDLRVDTSFRQRANHHATTAATIVALHEAALTQPSTLNPQPKAIAVFFPSYAYAEAIAKTLHDYGSTLRVALQPKLSDLAAQTAWVEENLALSDALFLVLGSSFAEGIDLLGGRVSHAMVVGPALPEVNAVQKAKADALAGLGREAAFRRVYQIPGLQKVNQALGRLVRAPGQQAKVLLHCRRFAEPSYSALLARDYQFFREVATDDDLRDWLAVR